MNNAQSAPPRLIKLAVLAIAAVIVLPLYAFGLSYPQLLRVRGDAYEYLSIARQFDGLSSVLSYAGARTAGFPILEFTVRKTLALFAPSVDTLLWVNTICFALLITHVATAWLFSSWTRRTNLIKSENGALFLFLFLGTFPALIGHTTTPLTDTLAIDLILCAIMTMGKSLIATNIFRALLLSGTAGLLFGLSILVRPGSLFGVAAALAAGGLISVFGAPRKIIVIGFTVLGCAAILAPYVSNCTEKYGTVCLQSPQTMGFAGSMQSGLRGARTLFGKWGATVPPGEIPTLPDEIMVNDYYRRCHLQSVVGIDESSWTGCLLSKPLSAPAYVVKKWIGLFDHFRFTPYLELSTPSWLRWLSRAYDSLAWVGLALLFWSLVQATKRKNRANIKDWLTNNITPAILIVYSVAMLAIHTVLHVEDRYGFPIVPLCAMLLVIYGEKAIAQYRTLGWRSVAPIVVYCVMAWALFVGQIVVWDGTSFY